MKMTVSAVAAIVIAGPAFAHVDPVVHSSVAAGLAHPVLGADHLLAMISVGMLAATASGKALWALPAAFVGAMALGFGLVLSGVQMPVVEPAILVSVIVLGGMVALAAKLPLAGLLVLGAGLGLFHGAAHGSETGGASIAEFAAGMLITTALLHGAGTLLAKATLSHLQASRAAIVLRTLGMAIAGAGIAMA